MHAGLEIHPRPALEEAGLNPAVFERAMTRLHRQLGILDQPPMDYVICACPRTGSHLLAESLASIGAGTPREYLNPMTSRGDEIVMRCGYLEPDPITYFQQVRRKNTLNGVFGVKIHYPQLAVFGDGPDVLTKLLPEAKYLSVTRRRTIRQAVSYATATQLAKQADQVTEEWVERSVRFLRGDGVLMRLARRIANTW